MNCIFCKQSLNLHRDWAPPTMEGLPEGVGFYAGSSTLIYMCKPCKSQQDYDKATGKLTYYNFRVGLYWLSFHPKYNFFNLGEDQPDDIGNTEDILTLNFLPNVTPQNTTIERIKLWLLFS